MASSDLRTTFLRSNDGHRRKVQWHANVAYVAFEREHLSYDTYPFWAASVIAAAWEPWMNLAIEVMSFDTKQDRR